MTTNDIDDVVFATTVELGAFPSALGYCGFPKSVCTSVNEVLCHGIPDDRPLEDGDIVNVDLTVFAFGLHGDLSETFAIGKSVDAVSQRLVKTAKGAVEAAIRICGPNVPFSSIGETIDRFVREEATLSRSPKSFGISRMFCGHGIGSYIHGLPYILHYKNSVPPDVIGGDLMRKGMTFTIEPIITEGRGPNDDGDVEVVLWPDGWTAIAKDGGRSAQFEQTILITEKGAEVLTERKKTTK